MKKIITIIMVTISLLVITGCDNKNENTIEKGNTSTTSSSSNITNKVEINDGTITIDGAKLKEVSVKNTSSKVGNLSIIFDNPTDKVITLDCSQFTIQTENEKIKLANKDTVDIAANQSYNQWALPFANDGKLKTGDNVQVFFGETKLVDLTVK